MRYQATNENQGPFVRVQKITCEFPEPLQLHVGEFFSSGDTETTASFEQWYENRQSERWTRRHHSFAIERTFYGGATITQYQQEFKLIDAWYLACLLLAQVRFTTEPELQIGRPIHFVARETMIVLRWYHNSKPLLHAAPLPRAMGKGTLWVHPFN